MVRTVSCFDDAGAATFLDAGAVVGRLVAFKAPGFLCADDRRAGAVFGTGFPGLVLGLDLVVAMSVSYDASIERCHRQSPAIARGRRTPHDGSLIG
jgi:hypothetical protein